MDAVLVMASALDVATLAVFVPATAAIWRLHSGSPERLRLTAVGGFIALVPAAGFTVRTATGAPLPVWFLLLYLLKVLAMGYLLYANVSVLHRLAVTSNSKDKR